MILLSNELVTDYIRKYWFQYKKIAMILAYLRIVHHLSVGYVNLPNNVARLHIVYRLTLLKKRLNHLGLHRKGPRVQYSTISQVQKAIEVCMKPLFCCDCELGL